jgi:transposase-like protein
VVAASAFTMVWPAPTNRGLINAITACFPASIQIRCWFHRLGNLRAKLPDEVAGELMVHVYAVRDAPTLDAARVAKNADAPRSSRDSPTRKPRSSWCSPP